MDWDDCGCHFEKAELGETGSQVSAGVGLEDSVIEGVGRFDVCSCVEACTVSCCGRGRRRDLKLNVGRSAVNTNYLDG